MAKKECVNFGGGSCELPITNSIPSLARIEARKDGVETLIDTTDQNTMINFFGLHEMKIPDPLPPRLVVTQPKYVDFLVCKVSNCRSKQKECSHFNTT